MQYDPCDIFEGYEISTKDLTTYEKLTKGHNLPFIKQV